MQDGRKGEFLKILTISVPFTYAGSEFWEAIGEIDKLQQLMAMMIYRFKENDNASVTRQASHE